MSVATPPQPTRTPSPYVPGGSSSSLPAGSSGARTPSNQADKLPSERSGERTENKSLAPPGQDRAGRLLSLDAYRGFIMLAMASSALGFTEVAKKAEVMEQFAGTSWDRAWRGMWEFLAYEFEHVPWTGCSFWDLIQPSFMFMVGVAMPFSNARRQKEGQSQLGRWVHVLWRALFLVLLGVFLSSNGSKMTNFTFVNVLTQIGLGYAVLYLVSEKSGRRENLGGWLKFQFAVALVILVGYWGWFATYSIPSSEMASLEKAIRAKPNKDESEWSQFKGFGSHWNKHTNAAAAVDRQLLNRVPREGDPIDGRKFWFNDGGYQTLNFIPSLATMIFGLMAGTVLRSDATERQKLRWLLLAGLLCFLATMPIDSTIWPWPLSKLGVDWTFCPAVKRIWTPTWAVFSSGWTFWILGAFYWVIDLKLYRRWAWPLAVVGVNSIAMYCMSQLMRGFTRSSLTRHLTTLDTVFGWEQGSVYYLFDESFAYSPITSRVAVLFVFWLVCLWLYMQKIFVRI